MSDDEAVTVPELLAHVKRLQADLKSVVRERPEKTFLEVREEAVAYSEDSPRPEGGKISAAHSVVECSAIRPSVRAPLSAMAQTSAAAETPDVASFTLALQAQEKVLLGLNEIHTTNGGHAGGRVSTDSISQPSASVNATFRSAVWRSTDATKGNPHLLPLRAGGSPGRGVSAEIPSPGIFTAVGKLPPRTAMSQAVTTGEPGSMVDGPPDSFLRRAIGKCPEADIEVGGVKVAALLDTGSEVSTITETFYRRHFRDRKLMETAGWLKLTAANGLDIPYVGYLELDVVCEGQLLTWRGFLVVKDSMNPETKDRKALVPVVLGMNVLGRGQEALRAELGTAFLRRVSASWREALQGVAKHTVSARAFARVAGASDVRVPAGAISAIRVTGSDECRDQADVVLVEPLREALPGHPL